MGVLSLVIGAAETAVGAYLAIGVGFAGFASLLTILGRVRAGDRVTWDRTDTVVMAAAVVLWPLAVWAEIKERVRR